MKLKIESTALMLVLFGYGQTCVPVSASTPFKQGDKPNILFIAVDDLNHWVRHLGRNEQSITPNIDRLASKGVSFTRAYCVAPACNPSRTAVMSGIRPSSSGVYINPEDWRPHIDMEKTLPGYFRSRGYYAAGAGKIYHGAFKRDSDWDDYMEEGVQTPRFTGNPDGVGGIKFGPLDCQDEDMNDFHVASWIIEQLNRQQDKPFFLACGLYRPHMPWNVPQKYFDMHPLNAIRLPPVAEGDLNDVPEAGRRMAKPEGDHAKMLESGRWKEAVQAYLASMTFADAQVGRVLEALERSPYLDQTIVVLWGDHGWHLGEKEHWRKFALWEEATRAPLIWVVPGLAPQGVYCERTVDFIGIFPTLTELCGLRLPDHLEGESLVPLLKNPNQEWSKPALTTHGFRNHAVRTERFRYIRYANGDEELYDSLEDPYEWTNLADRQEMEAVKSDLIRWFPLKNHPPVGNRR